MPLDAEALRCRFAADGGPLSPLDLLRALRASGFRARIRRCRPGQLRRLACPFLIFARDGSVAVVGRVEDKHVLILDPRLGRPVLVPRETFLEVWDGRVLLLVPRERPSTAFGPGWFLREALRHRLAVGEVLAGSFALQMAALATPLLFQVVVDKVLVHGATATLDVVTVTFVAIILFEAVLGGLRSYLLTHTAQRIDVVLGLDVFRHLLDLPYSWFGARPAGQIVARLRELENLREFLTGAALTLILDLTFAIAFVAVMWLYSPHLTVLVLLSFPAYVLLVVGLVPVLRRRLEERFARSARLQAFLVETVTGIETVKAMGLTPRLSRRYEELLAAHAASAFRAARTAILGSQGVQFVGRLTTVLVL